MDIDRYPRAVAAYLQIEGWETSGTRVRDGVFAILARRDGTDERQRLLTLVVADPDETVQTQHVKYLLNAAKKKDADRTCLTTQGSVSADARTIAEEYGVDRLDSETVVAAVTSDDRQTPDQSADPDQATGEQSARSGPDQTTARQPQHRARGQQSQSQQATPDQQARQDQRGLTWALQQSVTRLRRLEVPEDGSQRLREAVRGVPLRGGIVRGVVIYVAAVVFAAVLHVFVTGSQVDALFVTTTGGGPGPSPGGLAATETGGQAGTPVPAPVLEGAWLFYSAQGVPVVGAGLPADGNLIAAAVDGNIAQETERLYAAGLSANRDGSLSDVGNIFVAFRLLYLIVPFLLFTEAYRLVGTAYDAGDSLLDQAVGGGALLAGYLPLAVVGTFVFTRAGGPALGHTVVMATATALVYGGAGGLAAATFRDGDARLRQGGYYGFGAFALATVGVFALTLLGGGTSNPLVATLVLLSHAAALAVPPTETAVPGILYSLAVVASLVVVGRLLVRNHRGSQRPFDAARKGSTLAAGFGAGLFATLFVVLVFLVSFDATLFRRAVTPLGLTPREATPMHPVRTVVIGGVLLPALIGGSVGGYLAEK